MPRVWQTYKHRVEIFPGKCRFSLETYAGDPDREALSQGLRTRFGKDVELDLVSFGQLTDYREVRQSKPILRLVDHRPVSEQTIPAHL